MLSIHVGKEVSPRNKEKQKTIFTYVWLGHATFAMEWTAGAADNQGKKPLTMTKKIWCYVVGRTSRHSRETAAEKPDIRRENSITLILVSICSS